MSLQNIRAATAAATSALCQWNLELGMQDLVISHDCAINITVDESDTYQ